MLAAVTGDPVEATSGEEVVIVLGQRRGEDLSDSQEGQERTRDNKDKKQEGKFQMRFNGKKNSP